MVEPFSRSGCSARYESSGACFQLGVSIHEPARLLRAASGRRPKELTMTLRQKRTACFSLLIFLLVVGEIGAHAQTLYRVTIQQGVRAKMRDGVALVADVYRPVSDEKFPVLPR